MKRIITLGLLTFLAACSATPLLSLPEQPRGSKAVAVSPTASSTPPASPRDVFYLSDRFGYRIVSPSGYIITPSETTPSTQPTTPLEVLEVWKQSDFLTRISLPETPPIISITVYNNSPQLPLTHWKGELSSNEEQPLTVAGQKAIAYTSTGLYEYDNVLFTSPDSRYVFRLSVGYQDAEAPIRQTFQELVSNFTFDVLPSSSSPSKWRINYSHLENLLTAQNWQAADVETRAILQRLARPQGDLLFSSKSVFNDIPLEDLRTLDTLWSTASNGRFGFSAQQRIWQQVAKDAKNSKARVDRFAQAVGWHRTQPLPESNPVGMELSGSLWQLDTELNYTAAAPAGHLPSVGVSSDRLTDMLNARSLGCGSCTIDAMYLVSDRYYDYLPAFFSKFK
ncbi:MAG: GUN4 domain-containing protein [Kastovskya adunca ATA6-11-RM4]|jgi:hypothetical protein|nr:GUN4 domain-containing protein [Kastovskya adunca ATA6-11-RM4]